MQRRFCVWAAFVSALILLSTTQAAVLKESYASATITFASGSPVTSGVYDDTDTYTSNMGRPGTAKTKPIKVEYIRGMSTDFFSILTGSYKPADGWVYQSRVQELSDDSLIVKTYDVQGTTARVGCEFHLIYEPHGADPTTNLHWIQVVKDNHAIKDDGTDEGHGTAEFEVDNPFSPSKRSPYYDDGGAAISTAFYDFPGRSDTDNNHEWIAELMLVQGPAIPAGNTAAPGTVTFLGGVRWGWENVVVPEPMMASLFAMAGVMLRRTRRAA